MAALSSAVPILPGTGFKKCSSDRAAAEIDDMTVCVAAITEGIVLGAADRLVTFDGIQYEPDQTKIYRVSSSVG